MKLAYWLGYTLFKNIARGLFNYRVIGKEKLQVEGGALIVCNHASFIDPPIVGVAFDEEIYFLARKSLMTNPIAKAVYLAWNSVPVDQDRPDMTSLKNIIKLLKQGQKVLVFPEGERTLDGEMKTGEPGVGLIVSKAGVPVIPVRLFGAREALPRNKAFMQPEEITLVVGDLWHFDPSKYTETGKNLYKKISQDLMGEIAQLQL
jgi:1-acyl-sn-glycerol-3-phosphate acyltransferase